MQSVITCVTKPNESLFPPVRLGIQTLWVVILSLIFLGAGFFPEIKLFAQQAHYLPLHTTLEFVAMTISAMVFALAWNLRSKAENSQNMILGIGFLAVCIIDLAHTLSYDGMPDFFSINAGDKTLSFWLAGRFTAAAVFLAVALRPLTRWSQTACRSALTAAFALAGAVWWIILEHGDWLPRMYIEGQGLSDFKIGAEYLLTLIYGSASTLLWIKSRRSGNQDLLWLAAAAWVQGLAELFFSLYTGFSDLSNLLGHVYKAVAYLMVYRAIFVAGVQAPYRELAVERSRLQALLSTIPDLVWLKAPNGVYLSCNARFEDFFGAKETEIVGKTDFDFVDQELAEFFRKQDQQAMGLGGPSSNEEWLTFGKDGYHGLFETTKTPVYDEEGQIIGVLGIAHDISQRQEAAAALEKNQLQLEALVSARTSELARAKDIAESASLAKSTFLANMSHEIRTPMNAILGMANILRREGISPTQADRLDKIDTASKHLLSIISNILDLSKIEAGKFNLEESSLSIDLLLKDINALVAERARTKGIQFIIESDNNIPQNLLGDSTRLQQALLNYVVNAIKFSANGRVTLRARLQEEHVEDIGILFEVEDNGIGINPDALPRLFSTFEQADNSMTRKYGGTGLGLSITRHLAELMGGKVGCVSTLGQGSTFWFTARLKKNSADLVAPPLDHSVCNIKQTLNNDFKGRRLLLVEDDSVNREIALFLLEDTGLIIDVAEDGDIAVEMAARHDYALILMDMQMPKMSGVDATRLIRERTTGKQVPIVAMTANAFAEDRKRCIEAGMNDFIAKPVEPHKLFATILKSLAWKKR